MTTADLPPTISVEIYCPAMSTVATTAEVRPVRYRKLRIAWSVAWGVVAVLLCTLWVRGAGFIAPYWALVTLAGIFARLPFRFSLRSLLIATTLVAVGLGVVVWLI